MANAYFQAGIAVILTIIGQLLFKQAAIKETGTGLIRYYLNRFTVSAYVLLIISTIMNLSAYRILSINSAVIFLPFTFIGVIIGAIILFRERMSLKQALSAGIIIVGIAIYCI